MDNTVLLHLQYLQYRRPYYSGMCSLYTGVHTKAESYNSEHSNILHGLTWRHKFVYVSPVNLSRIRLGQFTTTRHILKQHICTLTRLLILILLLIAGIEANQVQTCTILSPTNLKQHYCTILINARMCN